MDLALLNPIIQAGVGTLALVILLLILLKVIELLGQGVKARNEDHKESNEFQGRLVTLSEQLASLITQNTTVVNTTNTNVQIVLTRIDKLDSMLTTLSDGQKELKKDTSDAIHQEITGLKESIVLLLTKTDTNETTNKS